MSKPFNLPVAKYIGFDDDLIHGEKYYVEPFGELQYWAYNMDGKVISYDNMGCFMLERKKDIPEVGI